MGGKSHPVWVRGLKHIQTKIITAKDVSHPVWVRGLKQEVQGYLQRIDGGRTPCGCVD